MDDTQNPLYDALVINVGRPMLITNDGLFAAALRLILDATPNWTPHDGDVLTIHCTTSYVLAPYSVRAFVTGPKIEAARLIGRLTAPLPE